MSHFARVENNIVTQIITADQDFIDLLPDSDLWIQTSYNTQGNVHMLGGTPLRGNFAGIGYTYDSVNDVFYPEQPFASWSLNTTTWTWMPPSNPPQDGKMYSWDESTLSWQ